MEKIEKLNKLGRVIKQTEFFKIKEMYHKFIKSKNEEFTIKSEIMGEFNVRMELFYGMPTITIYRKGLTPFVNEIIHNLTDVCMAIFTNFQIV